MKKLIISLLSIVLVAFNLISQDKNNTNFSTDSIKIIDMQPFNYISYEMSGSYNKMEAAYTTLWEESTKQFLDYDYAFFSISQNSSANTPEDKLVWEVGTKLNVDDDVALPLKKKNWVYKSIAKAVYNGSFGSGLTDAYSKTYEWIGKNGYHVAGPALQRHLNRPQPNDKGELVGMVEIWIPVKK